MADNLRHAQYSNDAVQIDNPQDLYPSVQIAGSYTWANKPSAIGIAEAVIKITDVGSAGSSGSHWISDGTYWRPLNGCVVLAALQGSLTTPINTISAATAGSFVFPAVNVPAGSLIPGRSRLEFSFKVRRTGATATAILSVYLGTTKSTATDPVMYALSLTATTLLDTFGNPVIDIAESGRIVSSNYMAMGGGGSASVFLERTTNINTLAEMGISIGISSANVADSFSLISYELKLYS